VKVRYRHVEGIANQVREQHRDSKKVPVPVEELIRLQDIQVTSSKLDEEVSGLSLVEGGVRIISVRSTDSKKRRRFTLAHELGHLLLHHDQSVNVFHGDAVYYRDRLSSQGDSWREIEANHFAACLLMPEELLLKALKAKVPKGGAIRDETIEELATDFDVSVQAMSIRLANLGMDR
jgi:Zn-dependent peptidase ImmA (M78 family)